MMTSRGGLMDTSLQTAFSTPSRIPVLARKYLLLSDGGSQASGQENRDPKGMMQRKIFRAQFLQKDLVSSKHKLKQQAVGLKGEKNRPRAPLEEISLGSVGQNVKADPPSRPGTALRSRTKTFLAVDCLDRKELAPARSTGRVAKLNPGHLTTTLSSMELTSGDPPCQTGLAQRVLIRGNQNQKDAYCGVQDSPDFPWTSHSRFTPGQVGQAGQASPFGLANRVPVTCPPALTSYSVVRHLAVFSKTSQATPAPASSLQQEQIVVKRLYEESWIDLEEKPEKPSPITPLNRISLELNRHQADPRDIGVVTPSNRISLELSRHKVGSRDGKVSAPSNLMSLELSRHEVDSKDGGVGTSSNKMSLELSTHERISILKQLLQQEVKGLTKVEDNHQSGKSHLKLIEPKLAMIPCISEPSDHCSALPNLQGPKQHPNVGEPISTGSPGIQELIQQPNFGMCTTASTNLTFFQCPLCGSIPLHSLDSLRSPMGTIGPAVLALCQQLNAWLEAIRLFYEGCLDDECAFYTGRGIPGPQRICKNPVATWLERQEAMVKPNGFCSNLFSRSLGLFQISLHFDPPYLLYVYLFF
ncbi:tastin isoform X2 [Antechinus flavipes]|uniref:tastin isoform X2 n=1 Tax=Antechinus flavipes TaxID=38775 RepID=UPI002236B691|nr:tastin isoform X2 [Antechinus flavipes]